ncbi:MAG: TonB-dependent receptor [Actinomycetota bacterium]
MSSKKGLQYFQKHRLSFCVLLYLMIISGVSGVLGQTSFGQVSGSVSDSAGAAVPNATVTVTNPATNFSRTATTDSNGFYTVTNLPVGTYSVSVEVQNFKKSVKTENSLSADQRLTVDFALEAGQISEVVEITQTSGETVNTTSGEVAKVIDSQQVDNLALNGRNYYQLLSVIPGAVVTADDSLDTNLATNTININGNRGVSNNLTVDGGNNLNAGSNASQINNVGLDFIQEVKLETSNFSAEYGRNSGAQINVVTKRGTNSYHGSLFEFLRNDRFDARDAFAATKPKLRYNNYGYSIGGPVPFPNFGEGVPFFSSGKDKFFFFAGQEWKTIHRSGASNRQTLPTTAELNGDFSFRLRGADGIVGTADDGVLRDPALTGGCTAQVINATTGVITPANRTGCFGVNDVSLRNRIPLSRITPNGLAFSNLYRTMIGLAAGFTDTPTANNTTFQPPLTSDFRQEFVRLDYIFNDKQSIYGRYIHDTNVVVDPYGTFINSPLPTSQELRNRPGNGFQAGYLWNIRATLINDLRFSAAWSNQVVAPNTGYAYRETYGFTFPQLFPTGGQYENSIPNTSFSGTGTVANFSGVAATLTALTRDYSLNDTLTWVSGDHTVKFGGLFNFNQTYQNGRSLYAGSVNFNTGGNPNSSGNAFADALLGNYRTYSEASYDPASHFRFKQYEAFVSDNWRVNKRLSLELGVRYQFGTPFYTAENTVTNFDPAYYDPARAVTLNAAGTIVTIGPGANRFNGLIRAGDGVPLNYQGVVPSYNSPNVLAVPTGAPRGFSKGKNYFMPRVGFAYSPFNDGKTSIRGGFGMYYDRIEGNVIFPLENNPPFVDSANYENGNIASIRGGAVAALTPFAALTTISPDMVPSSTMNFSLGVQRELPWGIFVEATGVGNLGRHLTRQVDINSVPFAIVNANPTIPVAALRRYKGYSAINQRLSDATSHYYALQLYAAKRKGDLLATISYTWSKVLTDANVLTEAAEEGLAARSFNYGPASFDRRHIFVATYTYELPFFKKSNGFVKALLSGYEISGITRLQAGKPYTITGSSLTGAVNTTRRADVISSDLYLRDNRQWLNPAAFTFAPPTRLGNSGVSIVTGPVLAVTDFSIRKLFHFGEKRSLRFQGDVFNAFNRNNFSGIQTVTTNSGFGTFTTSGPGRSIQLGIKFLF